MHHTKPLSNFSKRLTLLDRPATSTALSARMARAAARASRDGATKRTPSLRAARPSAAGRTGRARRSRRERWARAEKGRQRQRFAGVRVYANTASAVGMCAKAKREEWLIVRCAWGALSCECGGRELFSVLLMRGRVILCVGFTGKCAMSHSDLCALSGGFSSQCMLALYLRSGGILFTLMERDF